MKNELNEMPIVITKDMYFKKDTHEILNKDAIESTINNEVIKFFDLEEKTYREETIEKMTKNLKSNFIQENLNKFVDNSYLIRIKQGGVPEGDAEEFTALNKIIRKITKDRPNDFADVLNKIVSIIKEKDLTKYNNEDDGDVEDTVEEELVEAIEEEEKKPDKLTKYINETVKSLYNTCSTELKEEYKQHYETFLKDNKKIIDKKVKEHLDKFRLDEEVGYTKNRRNNIVNLFDYIIDYHINKINWLDDGNVVTMITELKSGDKEFIVTSGSIAPSKFNVNVNRFKELHRCGTSFTLVIE